MTPYKNKHRQWPNLFNLILLMIILTAINFPFMANAQDLELRDMTISTTEFYAAENSITAGPGFTIAGSGDVTFRSGNFITLKPGFVVLNGGQFNGQAGVSTDVKEEINPELPKEFSLMQNYPNPFNPTTTIAYQLTKSGHVSLIIYDLLGKEIEILVSESQNRGKYQVIFDANGLVSGVYIYRLQTKDAVVTKKMVVMK